MEKDGLDLTPQRDEKFDIFFFSIYYGFAVDAYKGRTRFVDSNPGNWDREKLLRIGHQMVEESLLFRKEEDSYEFTPVEHSISRGGLELKLMGKIQKLGSDDITDISIEYTQETVDDNIPIFFILNTLYEQESLATDS